METRDTLSALDAHKVDAEMAIQLRQASLVLARAADACLEAIERDQQLTIMEALERGLQETPNRNVSSVLGWLSRYLVRLQFKRVARYLVRADLKLSDGRGVLQKPGTRVSEPTFRPR